MLGFKLGQLSGSITKTPTVIGRFTGEGGGDISFPHNDLADRHAALEIDADDTLWIRPLDGVDGSGTWINGEQIFERRRVRADDEIELGPLEHADVVFFARLEITGLVGGELVAEGALEITPAASAEESAIADELWTLIPPLTAAAQQTFAFRWAERALIEHAALELELGIPGGAELAAQLSALIVADREQAIAAKGIVEKIEAEVTSRIQQLRSARVAVERIRAARGALQTLKNAARALDTSTRNVDPSGLEQSASGGFVATAVHEESYYARGRAICAGAWARAAARARGVAAGAGEARLQREEVLLGPRETLDALEATTEDLPRIPREGEGENTEIEVEAPDILSVDVEHDPGVTVSIDVARDSVFPQHEQARTEAILSALLERLDARMEAALAASWRERCAVEVGANASLRELRVRLLEAARAHAGPGGDAELAVAAERGLQLDDVLAILRRRA